MSTEIAAVLTSASARLYCCSACCADARAGSRRRYSEATLHRITYITLAQRAGFSLEEIAEQLAMLPNIHPLPPKVWEPLRKKWEQRIDQNIAELKQLKIDLRRCARDASR